LSPDPHTLFATETLCGNSGKVCACIVNGCGGSGQRDAWNCDRFKRNDCNRWKGPENQHGHVGANNAFQTYSWGDNYVAMLEGFVKFPDTRDYRFNQYSDDSGFFSIAKNPVKDDVFTVPKWDDMLVVVQETGCCSRRWGNPIKGIKKDEIYYVRAWYKEGGGGDYGYFGWDHSNKAWYETIPLDYFVNIQDYTVKVILPKALKNLNELSKSYEEQLPLILEDRKALKGTQAAVEKQIDEFSTSISNSVNAKVAQSTKAANDAVKGVRGDFDKFKRETSNDLQKLRDDIENDVGEKVNELQVQVGLQETMLSDFKTNLIGAINQAANARLSALSAGDAPFLGREPKIITTDNGRLNFETPHERVTVNDVEIPNVDDVVATVNEGVATGFNYLADAMQGL